MSFCCRSGAAMARPADPLAESIGSCADPDHYRSGLVAADDIAASIQYMAKQPFIDANDVIVVGISTGGWASLALASRTPSLARPSSTLLAAAAATPAGNRMRCVAIGARLCRCAVLRRHGAHSHAVALFRRTTAISAGARPDHGARLDGQRRQGRSRNPAALSR